MEDESLRQIFYGCGGRVRCCRSIKCRMIFYTPLAQTYSYDVEEGIAFIGTKDPWSDVDEVIHASRKQRIPIYVYEDANHSLETGQVIQDLDILKDVMIKTNNYLSVEKQ